MKRKKGSSIQNKIWFWTSLLIILTLLTTALLINIVSRSVNIDNALTSNQRELALIVNNLEAKLTHIQDYAVSIAVDQRVIAELKEHPSPPEEETLRYQLKMELNKTVSSIMGLNRNVYMWDLVAANEAFFGVSGYDMTGVEQLVDTEYFQALRQHRGVTLSGPYQLEDGDGITPVFLAAKPVLDLESGVIYGYVVFVIRESSLASIFEDNMPKDIDASFYVLNEENQVVSSSDKALISQNIRRVGTFTEAELRRLYQTGNLTKQVEGRDMLYTMSQNLNEPVDWTVISCQPLDSLMVGQELLNRWIIAIGIIACLTALFISYLISRSLSRPIMELAKTIHAAAEGDLGRTANRQSGGEIEVLYEGFNHLMNTVNRLLKRVCQEQEEKSEFQFHLIQAQIKPHFLYNTLEMIQSLVDLGMGQTASRCISAMASFYRLSLNRGSEIISVQDEIRLSEQYMYLQKMRYIEYLDYHFEIPEELTRYQLPKMTLQPILENAIYHGIKEKQDHGMVSVSLEEAGEHLRFVIEDDGVGMTEETLRALQAAIRQPIPQNSGEAQRSFGMGSISLRLRLLYGGNYHFTVDSRYGSYTRVVLEIPKEMPTAASDYAKGGTAT